MYVPTPNQSTQRPSNTTTSLARTKKNEPFLHRNHSKTFPPQLLNPRPLRPNLPHKNKPLPLPLHPPKNPLPNLPLSFQHQSPLRRRFRPRTLLLSLHRSRSPHSLNKRYHLRLSLFHTDKCRDTTICTDGEGGVSCDNELYRRCVEFWVSG